MDERSALDLLEEGVLHFERLSALVPASALVTVSQLDLIRALNGTEGCAHLVGRDVPVELAAELFSFSQALSVQPEQPLFRALFPDSILALLLDDAARLFKTSPARRSRRARCRRTCARPYRRTTQTSAANRRLK